MRKPVEIRRGPATVRGPVDMHRSGPLKETSVFSATVVREARWEGERRCLEPGDFPSRSR